MSRTVLAPLSIVTAMLLLALGDSFVENVAVEMSVWQYHAIRAGMLLPLMAIAIAAFGSLRDVWPRRPVAVLTRSTFVVTALLCYFAAIPVVGIATAAAGLFTSPIFVVLISVVVFREPVGIRRWLGVAVGFIGVCLVLKVGSAPLTVMAVAPPLGGLFYALGIIWVRRHCQQEAAATMAFWNMMLFAAAGLAGMALGPMLDDLLGDVAGAGFLITPISLPSSEIISIIAGMGVLAALGMVLLAWGYRSAAASYAALFDYSFLLWVALFAWIIRDQVVDSTMVLGMVLIVAAGMLALSGLKNQAIGTEDV